MLDKNNLIESIKEMPDKFTLDELLDRLMVIDKINTGLLQVKEGKTLEHHEVKEKLAKWLN